MFLDLLRRKRSAAIVSAPACLHTNARKNTSISTKNGILIASLGQAFPFGRNGRSPCREGGADGRDVDTDLMEQGNTHPVLRGKADAGSMPGSTSSKAAVDRQRPLGIIRCSARDQVQICTLLLPKTWLAFRGRQSQIGRK